MTDRNRIDVDGGKYTVVGIEDGQLRALRHGEEWRTLTGDKLIFALAVELQEARERFAELAAALEQTEDYVTRHYLDTRIGAEILPMLTTPTERTSHETP